MCMNRGFDRFCKKFRGTGMEEMKYAQHLIQHILYLGRVTNLQRLNQVMVGEKVPEDLELNLQTEVGAVNALTDGIGNANKGRTTPPAQYLKR